MKRITLALAGLLFMLVAGAQTGEPPKPPVQTPEEHLKHFTEVLDKEVTLSAEQKQKVLASYKDFFARMEQLHAKYPPPPPPPPPPAPSAEMKKEMDKLMEDKDKAIKAVVSDEQFKKLKAIDERHKHMPPPPPPQEQ